MQTVVKSGQFQKRCVWAAVFAVVGIFRGMAAGEGLSHVLYYPTSMQAALSCGGECHLKVRLPRGKSKFRTVVWFHGGGLTSGSNSGWLRIGEDIAQIMVNYRLMSPTNAVRGADCIRDSAAAVSWALENVVRLGGDPRQVYVAGHSAGAYLSLMVGMAPQFLREFGHDNLEIAGIIAVSGQVSKHFNIREFEGDVDSQYRLKVDELSPFKYCSRRLPPILSVCGQPPWEWPMRNEENRLLVASCKAMGHRHVQFVEVPYASHQSVGAQSLPFLERFVCGDMPKPLEPPVPDDLPVFYGPMDLGHCAGSRCLASASIGEIDFSPYGDGILELCIDNGNAETLELTAFPTVPGESLASSVAQSGKRGARYRAVQGKSVWCMRVEDFLRGSGGTMVKRVNVRADMDDISGVRISNVFLRRTAKERPCAAQGPGPLRVLMIGNSFSLSVTNQLPQVAVELGRRLDLASLYISGCSLETHWRNMLRDGAASFAPYQYDRFVDGRQVVCHAQTNVCDILRSCAWDVVTLQQASHLSWRPESYEPFMGEIVATIRRLVPKARIMLQETWSYVPWESRLSGWGIGQHGMYERLHRSYASAAKKYDLGVIPMGRVVQDWRNTLPVRYTENSFGGDVVGGRFKKPEEQFRQVDGKWRPDSDLCHLNERGKYLQALVWAASLYGGDLASLRYHPGFVSSDEAVKMKKLACDDVMGNDRAK